MTTTQQAKQLTALTDITSQLFKQWKGGTRVCSMVPQIKQCMEGKGSCIIANGHYFEGSMRNGIMNGKCKIKWSDGTIYEGQVQNNVLKGKGRYCWPNSSTYEGDILNGLRHGEGKFQCPVLGVRYEGGWKYGLRHGYGVLVYKDGTIYKGTWQNGKKHGFGNMTYPSGNDYEGNWRNDMKHGKGVMVWKTRNQRYQGGWEEDLPSGYGCHVWFYKVFKNAQSDNVIPQAAQAYEEESESKRRDSRVQSPPFSMASSPENVSPQQINQKKSFTNKFDAKYPEGPRKHSFSHSPLPANDRKTPLPNIVTPQFRAQSNLVPPSSATTVNSNKEQEGQYRGFKIATPRSNTHNLQLTNRYLGNFRCGVRNGQGIFFYSDGSKYQGQWQNNVKHGYGVFTFADGDFHQGEFELDHMINPPPKLQSRYNRAIMSFEDAKEQQKRIQKAKRQAEKNKPKYNFMRSARQSSQNVIFAENDASKQQTKTRRMSITSFTSNTKGLKKVGNVKENDLYENPFLQIIDIDDILQISCILKPDSIIPELKKQIANLLLRHNSELKKCYRYYTNGIELIEKQKKVIIQAKKANKGIMDQIDQESCFSMRMRQFWRLFRDAGIRSPSISIAQINRCLAMAKRSRFDIYQRKKGKTLPVGVTQSLGFNYKYQKGQDRIGGAESGIFPAFTNQPDFDIRLQNQRQQFQTLQTQNKSGKMMIAALQSGGVLSSGGMSPTGFQIQSSGGTSQNMAKKSSLFHLKKGDSIAKMQGGNYSPDQTTEENIFNLPEQKYVPQQIDINWQHELKQFDECDSEQETAELLQELFVSYPQNIVDIHQSSQPIFFRQFIQGIVRIAFLQFQQNPNKYDSFYNAAEQILEQRILKNLGRTNIRSQEEQFYLNKSEKIFDKYQQKLLRLFECGLSNQLRHGSNMAALRKDVTVTGYDILRLLSCIGMLEQDELKKLDFKNYKEEQKIRLEKMRIFKEKNNQALKKQKEEEVQQNLNIASNSEVIQDQKSFQLDYQEKPQQVKLLNLVEALKLIQKGFNRQESMGYMILTHKTNEQLRNQAKKLLNSQFIFHQFKQIIVLLIIKLQTNEEQEENKTGVRRYLKSFLKKVLFPILEKMQEDSDIKWRRDFQDRGEGVRRVQMFSQKDRIKADLIEMKQKELDQERSRLIQQMRIRKEEDEKKRLQDMATAKVVIINQQGTKVRQTSPQSRTRTPSILDRLATQDLSSKLLLSSVNTSSGDEDDDDSDSEMVDVGED